MGVCLCVCVCVGVGVCVRMCVRADGILCLHTRKGLRFRLLDFRV